MWFNQKMKLWWSGVLKTNNAISTHTGAQKVDYQRRWSAFVPCNSFQFLCSRRKSRAALFSVNSCRGKSWLCWGWVCDRAEIFRRSRVYFWVSWYRRPMSYMFALCTMWMLRTRAYWPLELSRDLAHRSWCVRSHLECLFGEILCASGQTIRVRHLRRRVAHLFKLGGQRLCPKEITHVFWSILNSEKC